ncbi:MAG: hypothetical protein RSD85_05070 [Erysipelotrichaceae bacterium]
MKRYIQRNIETLIARKMIEHEMHSDQIIKLDVKDGNYIIEITN